MNLKLKQQNQVEILNAIKGVRYELKVAETTIEKLDVLDRLASLYSLLDVEFIKEHVKESKLYDKIA